MKFDSGHVLLKDSALRHLHHVDPLHVYTIVQEILYKHEQGDVGDAGNRTQETNGQEGVWRSAWKIGGRFVLVETREHQTTIWVKEER